jgi:hypothetical protein
MLMRRIKGFALLVLLASFVSIGGCGTTFTVLDAATGKGIPQAQIHCGQSSPKLPATIITDAWGNAHVPGIVFSAHAIVNANGYQPAYAVLGNEVGNYTIKLKPKTTSTAPSN